MVLGPVVRWRVEPHFADDGRVEIDCALNKGNTYGPGGDGFMRMNIASTRKMIVQAMEQLKEAHGRVSAKN